jgi:PAS domain-containing protein
MTFDDSKLLSPQEMEERFDSLVTNVKEYAVFLVGPGGNVLCWNPGAERIFGYWFCSKSCRSRFEADPRKFVKRTSANGRMRRRCAHFLTIENEGDLASLRDETS